jgi:hypothetical protein
VEIYHCARNGGDSWFITSDILIVLTGESPCLLDWLGDGHIDRDIDVAARGLGRWTSLVRGVHQRMGNFALQARQANIEASPQKKSPPVLQKSTSASMAVATGRAIFQFAGCNPHRSFEAGRPAGGGHLLGVGAGTRGARGG